MFSDEILISGLLDTIKKNEKIIENNLWALKQYDAAKKYKKKLLDIKKELIEMTENDVVVPSEFEESERIQKCIDEVMADVFDYTQANKKKLEEIRKEIALRK